MSVALRFQRYVEPEPTTGCFLWVGAIGTTGYGRFMLRGKTWFAHRVAYVLAHGAIPDGACVLHSCDNRACVNPTHLHIGDKGMNAREREARNRGARAHKTHCKQGHPYNATNTYVWAGLPGTRRCRICRAKHNGAKK